MGILGVIFALLVVAEAFVSPRGALGTGMLVAGWVLWGIFVIEFLARLVIAPSKSAFFQRNWWQAVFLIFPFLRLFRMLRFVRLARAGRVARAGRLVSSSVRFSRSASMALTGRIGWLVGVTVIVVLSSGQMLFEFGGYESYPDALYRSALAAVTGQPLTGDSVAVRLLTLGLAVYSVVVFAALAAILGAFFVGEKDAGR
ncbi:MAG: hypothetical protein KY393_06310 [Actinobacteria bacterium]|nr:hypothetical protein [Actinomycetota bacterium]